jgi:AGZA family xanthine/uracil permease-like MFS transporter
VLFDWLPKAAMFPILVFVGLEITAQSFHATPARHYPALALAMLPALAYLCVVAIKTTAGPMLVPGTPPSREVLQTLRCLSNGFLVSGLLWAAALVMILDGRLRAAAVYFAVAGACAFFGIIHSPLADERIDLPWRALAMLDKNFVQAARYQSPYHWAAAYGLVALALVGLSCFSAEEKGTGADSEVAGAKETF